MSTLATPETTSTAPRTIVADPDETPETSGVEPGGILVWTNRSQRYPKFEIQFIGPSLASPGDILIGTGAVVVHVAANAEGIFDYQIQHIPAAGPTKTVGTFSIRSCKGC